MNNNALAFTALSREYCDTLVSASSGSPSRFVGSMLKLLPRIYIAASDLKPSAAMLLEEEDDSWLNPVLDEQAYDDVRASVAVLMGEEDVFLEVFEEDMKYGETPVAASISESLADIYQQLFNFLYTVADSTDDVIDSAILAVRTSFKEFWSQTLLNVLRALNHLWAAGLLPDDSDDEGMD